MKDLFVGVKRRVYLAIFTYMAVMCVVHASVSQFMYGIVAYVSFFAALVAFGWLQDR